MPGVGQILLPAEQCTSRAWQALAGQRTWCNTGNTAKLTRSKAGSHALACAVHHPLTSVEQLALCRRQQQDNPYRLPSLPSAGLGGPPGGAQAPSREQLQRATSRSAGSVSRNRCAPLTW